MEKHRFLWKPVFFDEMALGKLRAVGLMTGIYGLRHWRRGQRSKADCASLERSLKTGVGSRKSEEEIGRSFYMRLHRWYKTEWESSRLMELHHTHFLLQRSTVKNGEISGTKLPICQCVMGTGSKVWGLRPVGAPLARSAQSGDRSLKSEEERSAACGGILKGLHAPGGLDSCFP